MEQREVRVEVEVKTRWDGGEDVLPQSEGGRRASTPGRGNARGARKKKLADADRSALPFELLRMLPVAQVPVVASCMASMLAGAAVGGSRDRWRLGRSGDASAMGKRESGRHGGEEVAGLGGPHMALGDTSGLATMLGDLDLEGESMAAVQGGVEQRAAEARFLSKFNLTTPAARAAGPTQVEDTVGAGGKHGSRAEGKVAHQQGGKAGGSLWNGAERGEGKRGGGSRRRVQAPSRA